MHNEVWDQTEILQKNNYAIIDSCHNALVSWFPRPPPPPPRHSGGIHKYPMVISINSSTL